MYCYTLINNFQCIFNELILWTEISKEHPIFIKTVGELTNKNLSQDTINKLDEVSKHFSNLQSKSKEHKNLVTYSMKIHCSYIGKTRELVEEFLSLDKIALGVFTQVKEYGKDDKVWQTLLQHIGEEQTFMYELFSDLLKQFK